MLKLSKEYVEFAHVLEEFATPLNDLYHYTSFLGLKGIFTSKQLWLTDYRYLTDTTEVKYAISVIKKLILENSQKGNIQLFWEDLFFDIDSFIGSSLHLFTCSFCENRDYLDAWRAYGDDGKGFSIGFKKDFFCGSKESQPVNAPTFGRGKVFYNPAQLKEAILDLANFVHRELEKSYSLSNSAESKISRIKIARYFCAVILPFFTSIKDEAFEGEHEHRIYALMGENQRDQKFYTKENSELSDSSTFLKPRVYFSFDLKNISEIWVGPQLNFEQAKLNIQELLSLQIDESRVAEIQILKSKVPYKNKTNLMLIED